MQQRLCAAFNQQQTASAEELHRRADVPLPAHLWQHNETCAGGWDADLLPLHINLKGAAGRTPIDAGLARRVTGAPRAAALRQHGGRRSCSSCGKAPAARRF